MSNRINSSIYSDQPSLVIRELESAYRTLTELEQLIGEVFLSEDLKRILSQIRPHFRVAVLGDVSSGKSTFLNCLLQDVASGGLLPTSPVNETAVPVYIKYSPVPAIYAQHFTASILRILDNEIDRASMECEADRFQSNRIVMLKEAKARVIKDSHVVSGAIGASVTQGVVEPVNVSDGDIVTMRRAIASFSAISSDRDLSGIAKLFVGINTGFLAEARNIEFVDCVGSGEVSPVAEVKLGGVLNDDVDFIIYVFSDMGIKTSFTSLFDVEAATQIAACGRLLIVLNKIDSYDAQVRSRSSVEVARLFLDNLAKICPILKDRIDSSKVFLLSCEAMLGKLQWWKPREAESLRNLSENEIARLKTSFEESQHYLERRASSVQALAGEILSLVQMFDLFKDEVVRKLSESATLAAAFDNIVSELESSIGGSARHESTREAFTKVVTEKCEFVLQRLDVSAYSSRFRASSTGDPLTSFREIRRWAVSEARIIYKEFLAPLYRELTDVLDLYVSEAYETFAIRQDIIVQHCLDIEDDSTRIVTKPFSVTVAAKREILLSAERDPMRLLNRAKIFERFATQFLFHHCTWVTNDTKSNSALRAQLDKHVTACIKRYIGAFIMGTEAATLFSFGGPADCFMDAVEMQLAAIDADLEVQFGIYQRAMRIYSSHRYFAENREKYQSLLDSLLDNSVKLRSAIDQLSCVS